MTKEERNHLIGKVKKLAKAGYSELEIAELLEIKRVEVRRCLGKEG